MNIIREVVQSVEVRVRAAAQGEGPPGQTVRRRVGAAMTAEAPSPLFTATLALSDAHVKAVFHVRDCTTCPSQLAVFLHPDRYQWACDEGHRILEMIHTAQLDIAEAIARPMKREVAS